MNAGDKQLLKRVLKENEILKAKLTRSEAAVDILGKASDGSKSGGAGAGPAGVADAKTWKDIALTFAGKLITAGWSAVEACAMVGVHRTAWYRRLSPSTPPGIMVPHADRAYPNRITGAEADAFVGELRASR